MDEKRTLCLVCVSGTGEGGRRKEREKQRESENHAVFHKKIKINKKELMWYDKYYEFMTIVIFFLRKYYDYFFFREENIMTILPILGPSLQI